VLEKKWSKNLQREFNKYNRTENYDIGHLFALQEEEVMRSSGGCMQPGRREVPSPSDGKP
jgi:hypothetical protein